MTSWVAIVPFVAALLLGCATGVGETGGEETAAADTGTGVASCEDNAWIDFSLGIFRACGVHEDGCIECWGDVKADAVNDTGWTNYGLLQPPAVAARSVSIEANTIDDGEPSVCVVTSDDELACWGRPLFPELPARADVARVQLRDDRDVAIQSVDGAVGRFEYDWESDGTLVTDLGLADAGKLWAGVSGYCLVDDHELRCTSDQPEDSFSRDNVVAAGVGVQSACWTDGDGKLDCRELWGPYGEEVLAPPSGSFHSPCVSIMACAINTDDRAECWYTAETPVPFRGHSSAADVPLTQLRCDFWGACGITPDGQLHCWGNDTSMHHPPGSFVIPYGTP